MRIIFVSNNWDDAHQQIRLDKIGKMGFEVLPLGFKRPYYKGISNYHPVWLGRMQHGTYLLRAFSYIQYAIRLTRLSRNSDWIYVFGFDLFVICCLVRILKRYRIAYEIPDIREKFFMRGIASCFLRFLEKISIPKADLIVPTSEAYVTEYFKKIRKISLRKYLVIENKVHPEQVENFQTFQRDLTNRKIRIGYFGVLRCPYTLQYLLNLASKGKFEIVLKGIFMPKTANFQDKISKSNGIVYLGPYSSQTDLSEMYSNIDVCWAAYPFSVNTSGNHLLARTNRYYESMYFRCPMILQRGSSDHIHAVRLGIKVIGISLAEIQETRFDIEKILTHDFLVTARHSQSLVADTEFLITDEYIRLRKCLMQKRL